MLMYVFSELKTISLEDEMQLEEGKAMDNQVCYALLTVQVLSHQINNIRMLTATNKALGLRLDSHSRQRAVWVPPSRCRPRLAVVSPARVQTRPRSRRPRQEADDKRVQHFSPVAARARVRSQDAGSGVQLRQVLAELVVGGLFSQVRTRGAEDGDELDAGLSASSPAVYDF